MSLSQFSDQLIHEQFSSAQYQLLHKIGEGGFGKVFKAIQVNTGQHVAIKFLAIEPHIDEQQKQRYVERFKSCLLYTSPSPRDRQKSRMPSSA